MTEITLRQYHLELDMLMNQEAPEEVIGHCRHILKYYPKNVTTYRFLGRALLSRARFEQAGDVFRRVLSVEPGDRLAHQGMSAVYRDRKNFASAIWHMERAFEQDPNNIAIQKNLRELYARQEDGDYGKLQLTRGALARMYVQSGLLEKAISELQNALKDHPDRIDLRVLLAHAMWESNYPVEAGEVATEVVRILPYCLDANRILAALWLKNNRPTDAQPFLARVEELDPYTALALVSADSEDDPFVLERLDWNVAEASMLSSATPDWVRDIGNVLEKPEDVKLSGEDSVPDWMLDMALSGPPPATPPSDSTETMPDWMNEASAGTAPGLLDDLDWMADIQQPDDQPVESSYLDRQVEAPGPADSDYDDEDLLNLLADIGGESAPADDAPVTPDWIPDTGRAPSGEMDWLDSLESSAEPPPPPDTTGNLPATPDWFAEVQAAALESAPQDDDLAWLGGNDAPPPVAADWMADAEASEPPKPVEPGERVPTGFTGLLGGLKDQDDEDEDPLAWLTTPSEEPPEEAEAAIEAEDEDIETGEGSTSWLRNAVAESELDDEDSAPADDLAWLELGGADDELPDALAEAAVSQPEPGAAVPDADDPLAWLYSEDAVLEEAAFEVSLDEPATRSDDDPLNWLRAATPEAEDEEESVMTSPPESDRPELWESQPEPDADDWLSALSGGQDETAPDDDDALDDVPAWLSQAAPEPPASASGDEEAEEDWLAAISLGAEASAGDSDEEEVPDWLSQMNMSADESPAEPAPDWLSRVGELGEVEPEISQPDFLFGADEEESEPAEETPPSWLSGIRQGETPVMPSRAAAEPPAEPEIEDGMRLDLADTPDWLDALGDEEETPAAPAQPEADWLSEDEGQPSGLVPEDATAWKGILGEEEPDMSSAAAEEEEAPDWLGAPPAQAEAAPDWLSELGAMSAEEEPAAEAEQMPAAEELPDWLSAMEPVDESSEEAPVSEELPAGEESPVAEAPAETGLEWPRQGITEEPETVELSAADWLSDLGPVEEEPAAEEQPVAETPVEAEAELDWSGLDLGGEEEETPEPAAADWLSELGSLEEETPAEEAPAAEGLPDWLSGMSPLDGAGEEEPAAEEQPVAETPVEAEAELDWSGLDLGGEEEVETPEPAAADWLSELGSLDEEVPAEETPAEEAPAAEGLPDWLSGMSPLDEAGEEEPAEEQPAAETPVEAEAALDWPGLDLGGEEEVETPEPAAADWLSELGSLDEEVPAEETPAEEAPAAEGLPDWLSGMSPLDEAGEEEPAEEQPVAESPVEAEAGLDWSGLDLGGEEEVETPEPAAADWLSELGSLDEEVPAEETPAEEAPVSEGLPDWLSGMSPLDEAGEEEPAAEEEPAVEEQPVAEIPVEAEAETDWSGLEIGEEVAATLEPAAADWLSELGAVSEEPPVEEAPAAEAEEAPAAEGLPDWLSAMPPVEEISEEEPVAEEVPAAEELPVAEAPVEAEAEVEAAIEEAQALPLGEADLSRLVEAEVTPTEAEPAEEPSAWLDQTQPVGVDHDEELAALAAEVEETAEAASQAEFATDWLGQTQPVGADADFEAALDEMEAQAEEPAAEIEPAAEPGALPDWLSEVGASGADLVLDEEEKAPAAELEEAPAEAGALPDWLSESPVAELAEEETPVSEVPAEEISDADWLGDLGELELEAEAEIEEAETPLAEAGTLPDWLSESPVAELAEEETPVSEVPAEEISGADWLGDLGELEAEAEIEEAETPLAEAGALPDWLSQMAGPAEDEAEEAVPEAEVEAAAEPADLPAWLSQEMPVVEEEALDEADEGLPAWLDEESIEPLAAMPEEVEDDFALEDVSPEEAAPERPAVTAGEKVSIHDTLEWLSDIGSLEAEPEEGLVGDTLPVADAQTGPQWLRDVGMLQPEEQAASEALGEAPDAQVAPEPEPEPEPEARPAARFSFGDLEPRWARREAGPAAAQPPASLPEEPAAAEEDDLTQSPSWLDEDSGPAWLRRVIEEEDDSEG